MCQPLRQPGTSKRSPIGANPECHMVVHPRDTVFLKAQCSVSDGEQEIVPNFEKLVPCRARGDRPSYTSPEWQTPRFGLGTLLTHIHRGLMQIVTDVLKTP